MVTDNSPTKVISRLIHRDEADYFKNLGEEHLKSFASSIMNHVKRCQHPFCKEFNF